MILKNWKKHRLNLLLVAGLLLVLATTGCKKMDTTYYHFQTKAGSFKGNAIQYLRDQGGLYDSMLLAINRVTGLKDSIVAGDVTLFAMTNASFELALSNLNGVRRQNNPPRVPLSIATLDSAQLDTLMCRYVIPGMYNTDSVSEFADGLTVPCLRYGYLMQLQYKHTNSSGYQHGGPEYLVFSDRNKSIFSRYWVSATTISVNIKTNNSFIHILSPGHSFGFGQIIERMNK